MSPYTLQPNDRVRLTRDLQPDHPTRGKRKGQTGSIRGTRELSRGPEFLVQFDGDAGTNPDFWLTADWLEPLAAEKRLRQTIAKLPFTPQITMLLAAVSSPVTDDEWERFAGPGDRTRSELNELIEKRLEGALAGAQAVSDSSLGDLEELLRSATLQALGMQESPNVGLQARGSGEADVCIRVKAPAPDQSSKEAYQEALPRLLAELLWEFTRQRGEAVEHRDSLGRTARQFLAETFEFETCSECGGDAADHIPELLLGNWFARCKAAPVNGGND